MNARQDAQTRVKQGMALLDNTIPGWEQAVDTKSIEIASAHRCILAQIGYNKFEIADSPFTEVTKMIGLEVNAEMVAHGFCPDNCGSLCAGVFYEMDEQDLNAVWKEKIEERLTPVAKPDTVVYVSKLEYNFSVDGYSTESLTPGPCKVWQS